MKTVFRSLAKRVAAMIAAAAGTAFVLVPEQALALETAIVGLLVVVVEIFFERET